MKPASAGIFSFRNISRPLAKSPDLVAGAAPALALQNDGCIWKANSAPLSLDPKSRFPEIETAGCREWFECGAQGGQRPTFNVFHY
jgi:hypothetical protein